MLLVCLDDVTEYWSCMSYYVIFEHDHMYYDFVSLELIMVLHNRFSLSV